jgi:chromosome segregation ATPase
MERTWQEAYEGNESALEELKRVEEEIENLQLELGAGTLDRRKLESGLRKLQKQVCEIEHHIPTFKR